MDCEEQLGKVGSEKVGRFVKENMVLIVKDQHGGGGDYYN